MPLNIMKTRIPTIRHKWYALYTTAAATVTASINGTEYTLASAHAAGTLVFPVAENSVSVETEGDFFLFPTEAAPASPGAEPIVSPVLQQGTASVTFGQTVWYCLAADGTACEVRPTPKEGTIYTMQLLLTPAANLPAGWLRASNGATLEWVGGEPYLVAGYSYIVTLVQVSPTRILANLNMPFTALA